MKKTRQVWIRNDGKGKVIAGHETQVHLLVEDADGTEEWVDLSAFVRAADIRLHVGDVVTARLEVFVTGIDSRAHIERVAVKELGIPPKWRRMLRRRLREITTFGRSHREYA